MNNYDELNKALVGLSNAAAGVREQLMHLPPQSHNNSECQLSVNSNNSVACIHEIAAQDVLRFDGGKEDIEVERLLRIIANASEASKRISSYIQYSEPANDVESSSKVPKSAAMNYVVKLRDSLGSLATLLGAEPTNNRFYDERPSVFKKDKEEIVTVNDAIEAAEKLTLAYVYQRLKTVKNSLRSQYNTHLTVPSEFVTVISDQLETLMDEIKEGNVNGQ